MTPVKRMLLVRLSAFTGLMTAGVTTTALGDGLGWWVALAWGAGAGLAAALAFAAWFVWKESRPPKQEE